MNSNPNKNELNFSEGNNAIFISHADMYYYKCITAEEIDEINKLIGVDNFISYPEEDGLGYGGDFDNPIKTVLIEICKNVFYGAIFESLKFAVVKLVEAMRKRFNKNKEKKYIIDFQVKDEQRGFSFDLKIDANASNEEIEGILDKAKAIAEIAKK